MSHLTHKTSVLVIWQIRQQLRQQIAPKVVPHVLHDYFSRIPPVLFLICDVVVAVAFVVSKLPDHSNGNEDERNLQI